MPTTPVRRLISLLSRSSGLVLRIWRRWDSGNAMWASRSGSASRGVRRPPGSGAAGCRSRGSPAPAPSPRRAARRSSGSRSRPCSGPSAGRGLGRGWHGRATLPGGAQKLLADRFHEAAVIVADDQAHAAQAALDEAPDEGRPGASLVVAGGELEPQDAPLAVRATRSRRGRPSTPPDPPRAP